MVVATIPGGTTQQYSRAGKTIEAAVAWVGVGGLGRVGGGSDETSRRQMLLLCGCEASVAKGYGGRPPLFARLWGWLGSIRID